MTDTGRAGSGTHLMWEGSTGAGYPGYGRGHTGDRTARDHGDRAQRRAAVPRRLRAHQSGAVARHGWGSRASCSPFSRSQRHDVDVLTYDDEAVGVMPADSTPMRITTITLAPRIVVAGGTDIALVEWIVQQAHEACYIANSLTTDVTVAPRVIHR